MGEGVPVSMFNIFRNAEESGPEVTTAERDCLRLLFRIIRADDSLPELGWPITYVKSGAAMVATAHEGRIGNGHKCIAHGVGATKLEALEDLRERLSELVKE